MKVLVAVGSRRDKICSIGAFARAEAKALEKVFDEVELLEPDSSDHYPNASAGSRPDVILFHAPSLHDRKRVWNAVLNALKLRRAYPRARFVPIVHEFSEAPAHWKLRQVAILKLAHGAVVNSSADQSQLSKWHSKIMRWPLGPTLFIPELLESRSQEERRAKLDILRHQARASLGIAKTQKWVVHPGLLTPGKGINFLSNLVPAFDHQTTLVLMGGKGPKERDRQFADQTIATLRSSLGERFVHIDSPSDEKFKQVLLASDLVVLPYDNGLSERRSSFLSAMCCGANIWTTIGPFSSGLGVENTGVHGVSLEKWNAADAIVVESVREALTESEEEVTHRRLKNLAWAEGRSWDVRVTKIRDFAASL